MKIIWAVSTILLWMKQKKDNNLCLTEAKNTNTQVIPSISDIKDGLLKMILFSNLSETTVDGKKYNPISVLKLTGKGGKLDENSKKILKSLKKEAEQNNFRIIFNGKYIDEAHNKFL